MSERHILVGLGSNMGDRLANLQLATDGLHQTDGIVVEAISQVYESPPMGPPQPDYLNAALRIRSALDPTDILRRAQQLERQSGRVREVPWGPRTLDVDLLWWNGPELQTLQLCLPHPGLTQRVFVLVPLLEVALSPPSEWKNALQALEVGSTVKGLGLRNLGPILSQNPRPIGYTRPKY